MIVRVRRIRGIPSVGFICVELPARAGDNGRGSYRNPASPRITEGLTVVESSQLRRAGLKITTPRLKILDILALSQPRHMSAEDVYRRLIESNEDIGLATVYRVLTQFEGAGLVTRHHFEGGTAVFELNEGTHHDHIVCVDCGRVEEFADEGIEERQRAIAKRLGFELRDHALTLHGHCVREHCPNRPRKR
jgi:Fur family transcriptional regulator, ferric uptake regulator